MHKGKGQMIHFKSAIQNLKLLIKNSQRWVYFLIVPLAVLVFTFDFSGAATGAKHYTELQFAPVPEVKLPKYERFVLNNGMAVYLMEDHDLPLVSGQVLVRTGERLEPTQKVGLADLVGTVMRTGGTKQHSPSQLNQILEQRAASVEAGIGATSGNVGFNALSEDVEMVFGLFAEVMRSPAFAQDQLDLAKTQVGGGIARRNDNAGEITGREFQKLIYGSNSPYARTVEYATLTPINRQDLSNFYEQYFHPNNVILGIVGDFDSQKMRSLIQAKFGDWQKTANSPPQLPAVSQAKSGGVFLVNKPDLTQSYVRIGHLGGKLDSPDYAALEVLNGVLNGFGGRLFNEVRSRQGLAYSVSGAWSPRYDYPGVFIAGGQTRSDATVPFIKAIRTEIQRLQTEKVKPAELAYAKDTVLNSFVFNFQDPSQTLSRLMRYEYYGYPADFIFRYRRGVEATTIDDIQRVAKQYLLPEKSVTLVVGNAAAIQQSLSQLTEPVTPIDITIVLPKR